MPEEVKRPNTWRKMMMMMMTKIYLLWRLETLFPEAKGKRKVNLLN